MKVFSVSDGIGTAGHILSELGEGGTYYTSEIDPYAMAVTQKQLGDKWDIVPMGNLMNITPEQVAKLKCDLFIGGPPCQEFSRLNKTASTDDIDKIFTGEKSKVTKQYIDLLKAAKPKHFFMENVSGLKPEVKEAINSYLSDAVGKPIEGQLFDSRYTGPMSRPRTFWSDINFEKKTHDLNRSPQATATGRDAFYDNVLDEVFNSKHETGTTLNSLRDVIDRKQKLAHFTDHEQEPNKWLWHSVTPAVGTPLASSGGMMNNDNALEKVHLRNSQGGLLYRRSPDGKYLYDPEGTIRNDKKYKDVVAYPTKENVDFKKLSTAERKAMANTFGQQGSILVHGIEPGERYDIRMPNAEELELLMDFPVGYTQLDEKELAAIADKFKNNEVDPDFVNYAGDARYDRQHMLGNSWDRQLNKRLFKQLLDSDKKVDRKDADYLEEFGVDSDSRLKNINAALLDKPKWIP
jgi:site-specific DNA-cytosine methylase